MSEHDELNDQGDYVSGAVGPDGKAIVVGKNITQDARTDSRSKDDNRRNESNNNFNFQNSDNQLFQLFLAIQNVQNGLSEFRSETRQSSVNISEKLDMNNRRLTSLEVRFDAQRKEIEVLKEEGDKRNQMLQAIQTKVDSPPVMVATTLKPYHFWYFLICIVIVALVIIEIGIFLMRTM